MKDCLPESWQKRINSRVMPYVLDMEGDRASLLRNGRLVGEMDFQQGQINTSEKVLLTPHEVPLVVKLPKKSVLSREISLPAAAKENLRQVIAYELDRFTPFNASQVYFDYKVLRLDDSGERLTVQVVVVPLKKLQSVFEPLQAANIPVDVVTAEGLDEGLNFLPKAARPGINLKRVIKRGAPAFIILSLIIGLLVMPLLQQRKIAIEMQAWENNLRNKAQQVLALREQLETQQQDLETVRQQWRKTPPLVNVLKELTDLLPNDTSLQKLDIKGNQLTMRGLSAQASSLISLLEKSPGFTDPHFLSSVTQQRGKELFNLSAQIVMPFPLSGETQPVPEGAAANNKGDKSRAATGGKG